MALLESILVKKPHFSNKNLSQKRRFTAMPGVLYPTYVEEVLPGDTFHVKVYGSVKTYPLKAPLMGSFRQQVAFFFVPTRLYTQEMDINRLEFEPSSVDFPFFRLTSLTPGSNVNSSTVLTAQVRKSSLLDCLGVSSGTVDFTPTGGTAIVGKLNATPLIGYYDIFRNYFANTQEPLYYACASPTFSPSVVAEWQSYGLSGIDMFINEFIKGQRDFRTASKVTPGLGFDPVQVSCLHPLGGLCLTTLRPDLYTAFLSKANYDDMVRSSVINVSDNASANYITVNQIRLQSRILEYYERGLVAGGRYDDWVESEFGIKTNKKLCIPEYLGSAYSDILFDEVVSTTNISDPEDRSEKPLGSLGGRGVGSLDSRTFHFTATENGYLMAMYVITPNIMHSSGVLPLFKKTDYQSLYAPVFSGLGFQPLPVFYFDSLPVLSGSTLDSTVSSGWSFGASLGYQPAWSEYTTAIDRVSGNFSAIDGDLSFWVLTRKTWQSVNKVTSPAGQFIGRTDRIFSTSYCLPWQFNLPFADQSPIAENFLVSLGFDVRARRPMPKHVMPSLS